MQYYLKLKSNPDNLTHKVVLERLYKDELLEKEKVISPYSLRCEADSNCIGCDLEDLANHNISEVPLWTSKSPTYNNYLASDKKATTNSGIFKNQFLEVKEEFYTREEIYTDTDGSKDWEKVVSAAILDCKLYQFRLPNICSIFPAELKAIDLALSHLKKTPIGDTLYILIPYQLCKHLRARKQITHLWSFSSRSCQDYANELI